MLVRHLPSIMTHRGPRDLPGSCAISRRSSPPCSIRRTRISPHNLPSLLSLATSVKGCFRFHSASSGVEPREVTLGTSSLNALEENACHAAACRIDRDNRPIVPDLPPIEF